MLDLMVWTLTIFSAVLVGLIIYLTWHFDYWTDRQIPGPKPKPLYGTFPSTITGKRNFIYDLDEVYNEYKRKHRFVGVFTTRNPQILILDPALAKEILINNFKCFQDNESSKWMNREREPISGSNPFVLPSAAWKIKRAEIVPGLTISKVKGMIPIFGAISKKLGKFLKKEVQSGKEIFDAKELCLRYTAEVVADTAWGIEAGTFNDHPVECTFLKMSKRMIAQTFVAFTYFFFVGLFPIIRKVFSVRFFPEATDKYFLSLAQVSSKMRSTMSTKNVRQDLLQHLVEMQQKKQLSDVEVVAHMLTFHFDGFETSATLISHCLLLLARNPDKQEKLRQEIIEFYNLHEGGECFGDNANDHLEFSDLMKMPYLEQCVAETLRIFTPLPFMAKICTEPCLLENNKNDKPLQVQVGNVCLISLHSFHHDEDFYPQAESFLPERFALENGGTKKFKDLGVYMPFGDGPRICLGMNFGLAQAKVAIVEIIKNFQLAIDEKRTRKDNWQAAHGFITGLEGGISLKITEIK